MATVPERRRRCPNLGPLPWAALLMFAVLLVGPLPLEAQGGGGAGAGATAIDTAMVSVDGYRLFSVRGATGYPAPVRAKGIADRIVALARDASVDLESIRVEPSDLGPRVTYGDGGETIVVVVASDAEREALTRDELGAVYVHQIRLTAERYRADRTSERVIWNVARAVLASVVFVLGLVAGRWVSRRIDRSLTARIEGAVDRLRIQSMKLVDRSQAWMVLRAVSRTLWLLLFATWIYAYLHLVLSRFPATRGYAMGMRDLVTAPMVSMSRAFVAWIPDLIFLIVLVIVVRVVLRFISLIFVEIEHGRVRFEGFDPEWAMPTYRLIRVLVLAFALVVAFPYIPGSSSGAFKGVSLFVGVLFSLGSSSIIGNIIAGYTMTYRRAFRVGDRIRVGDVVGDVTEVRLLVTHVRTPKNEDTVIPNSVILANTVTNYSAFARDRGLILHTRVGIGYEVPWRQVEAMLILAAERTEGLLREPPPFVLQTTLGDFAVTYELNVACDDPRRMASLYHQLHRNILDVFNEYGVAIMTPAYDRDPPEAKVVPRERWFESPARRPDGES